VVDEEFRGVEALAHGWKPIAPPAPATDPVVGDYVSAFRSVRCATLDCLRDEIRLTEQERPIHEWTLIPISKYPLLEIPERGTFVLSIARLGDSLFEGVRHAILATMRRRVLNAPSDGEFGRVLGDAFHRYVLELLRQVCPDHLIELPRAKKRK